MSRVRIPEWEERRLPRQCNLQKKGSLLLTRVDGIGPWVHCNHVRQATLEEQEKARAEWKARPHPSNPLKLKLVRREAS